MPASRKAGKPDQRPLLFICQDSVTLRRENLRAIVSHARKTQTKQKHNRRRVSAQRDATYARSLVGWQHDHAGAQEETILHRGTCPVLSQTNELCEPRADQMSKSIYLKMSSSLGMRRVDSGGLRMDPFASLPLNDSDDVMRLIDFCTFRGMLFVYAYHVY